MALTFRDNKGDALSFSEMDSNFRHFTGSFTNTGTITAAAFAGDGSAITGVTAEWDGTHNGNAQITGSLTITDWIRSADQKGLEGLSRLIISASNSISYSGTAQYFYIGSSNVLNLSDSEADFNIPIQTNSNITASGNISMPTNASSINMVNGSIYSRNGGSYPGIQLNSGVNNNTIWFLAGNNDSIGGEVTASFVSSGFINNVGIIRARANSSLLLQGGPAPNDANDGVKIETADASNVYQPRFQIESDTTNVDAYFTNINGLGINDSTPTATLDVNGNINTTSNITASGNISASATSTASLDYIETNVINHIGDPNTRISFGSDTFSFKGNGSQTLVGNGVYIWSKDQAIGGSSPFSPGIYELLMNADSAAKPTDDVWTVSSDERLKENIETASLDICYDTVKNLPLKRFTYKTSSFSSEQVQDRSQVGWIAQDVQPLLPKAIYSGSFTNYNGEVLYEDALGVNSSQIHKMLYGAVQKLIQKVETLEAQISGSS